MSFLMEDDAHTTLQVALAFIDACDDSSSSSSSSSSRSSPAPSSSSGGRSPAASNRIENDDVAMDATPTAVRRPTRTKQSEAVMRSRAKKKAEAQLLREQAADLEATLRELQHTRRTVGAGGGACGMNSVRFDGDYDEMMMTKIMPKAETSLWIEAATTQARERQQAQLLNTRLKDAVEKQGKAVKALEATLRRLTGQFDLDLLRDEQKQYIYSSASVTPESVIMAELRQRVQKMYSDLDCLFQHETWTEIADSVVCSSKLVRDNVGGPMVELRMNTPLYCAVHQAGDILWRRMMETSALIQTPNYFFQRRLLSNTSYQKSYMMLLEGPDGFVKLNGTSYAERFRDADRDAYMWTSVIFSSNPGEIFLEKGWMVATNQSAGKSVSHSHRHINKTLYRGLYQVVCDSSGVKNYPGATASSVEQREFVLHTMGSKTRGFHQLMQNLFLDEFANFQSGEYCPRITLTC